MRAIKIDPKSKEISEVEISPELPELYKHMRCGLITVALELPNGDTLFVDDEGFLTDPNPDGYWTLPECQALAGVGLILGAPDNEGNNTPAVTQLDTVRKHVTWLEHGSFPNPLDTPPQVIPIGTIDDFLKIQETRNKNLKGIFKNWK